MKKKILCLFLAVVLLAGASLVVYALERGNGNDYEIEQEYTYSYDDLHVDMPMRIIEFSTHDDYIVAMNDPEFTLNESDIVIIAGYCDNDACEHKHSADMFVEAFDFAGVFDDPELGYIIIESSQRGTIYIDNYESFIIAFENLEVGDIITVPVNEIVETIMFDSMEDMEEWLSKHNIELDIVDDDSFSARSCERPSHPIQHGAPWSTRTRLSRTFSQIGNSIVHPSPCTISVHSIICVSHQYRIDMHCGRSCGVFSSTTTTESGCREHRADIRGGPCRC